MGIEAYQQHNAVSNDPYKLVLKLYEGTLKYLSFVKEAMEIGDIEAKFSNINKAVAIFDELRNVLDFDNGGDVSYYLDGLYLYQIETLFSAGVDDNINAVDQVMKVVQGLIDSMERRDWSLKALEELTYIDSLESYERADALVKWYNKYLSDNDINEFDLLLSDLQRLQELFYKKYCFFKRA